MRHGKKFNHLGRKTAHRKAMLSNMACSLIEHKRITTTVAKAKELRKFVEPLINRSKEDSTHSRRVCFSYLKNKHAVSELFRDVAPKVSEREGGYTRIIRTGFRLGDSADMCLIELVDFNDIYGRDEKKAKTRRARRGGAKKKSDVASVAEAVSTPVAAPAAEEPQAIAEEPQTTVEEPEISSDDTADTDNEPKA
jgi:large subunit ribosomal protein L17